MPAALSLRPLLLMLFVSATVLPVAGASTDAIGSGPGGNGKTGFHAYGKDMPALQISRDGALCSLHNPRVWTADMAHGTRLDPALKAHAFPCSHNTARQVNGAASPLNDTHHAATATMALLAAQRDSGAYRGVIKLYVHYGREVRNAWWDGNGIIIGDGDQSTYPLATFGVIAHEIGHAYTEQHSALLHTGQAAAINESFSDMLAQALKFTERGVTNYQIGDEALKAADTAFRYMDEPRRDGSSIDHQRDHRPGMNHYTAAGIYNRAFYLLAQTEGWDVIKAFRVFAKANSDHWTPSTDFNRGACGVAQAAAALGYRTGDVEAAFAGVGVSCGN